MSGITSSSDGRDRRAPAGPNQAGLAENRSGNAVEPWIGQCMARIDALSQREQDVLRLLGRGLENRAIAMTLDIAERTVKQHVTRILTKLGCQSRLQAGLVAFAAHSVVSVQPGTPLSPSLWSSPRRREQPDGPSLA
jgi:DNA-binding NarL/FixJ family response regulator